MIERTAIVATLTAAAACLKRGWTQTRSAATAAGKSVDPTNPEATCWCITGAIIAVAGEKADEMQQACWERIAAHIRLQPPNYSSSAYGCIAEWNDDHSRNIDDISGLMEHSIRHIDDNSAYELRIGA